MIVRVAAAQYPVEYLKSFDAYAEKLEWWVKKAAMNGAKLLVFPEYASLELASLMPVEIQLFVPRQIEAIQVIRPDVLEVHAGLARKYNVYILAASFPVLKQGKYLNRASLFAPNGRRTSQDKLIMTRFEHDWGISGGSRLRVIETDLGKIGIVICYDSEFPLIARRLVDFGADVLLVPSATESKHGYNRVRIGSRARALENQCYSVMAPLIGSADWSEAIDINNGAAGVFGPIDHGFPENGVIVDGPMNVPTWVYADLDLEALRRVREDGQTQNSKDWPSSVNSANFTVESLRL
jgi:predicted amidohydrolase